VKSGISANMWISARWVVIHVCFIKESVTSSCRINGASKSWPLRPSSNCIVSPVAHNRKLVRSCGWLENFRRVCICNSICLVNKLGMFTLQNFRGPWARACGNVQINPANGRPCARMGDMMEWHCSAIKVGAGNG